MILNPLLASNPLLDAYFSSDLFGKLIFIALLLTSIISWAVIVQKIFALQQAKRASLQFYRHFAQHKQTPLSLTVDVTAERLPNNPFLHLYALLKKQTLDLLHKNQSSENAKEGYLLLPDISLMEAQLASGMAAQTQSLESNLYLLSTAVSLAPFLGLLGTVWGIFLTFSSLHMQASANQAIMDGISMALATTVCGLLAAIPALLGHNCLKNAVRSFTYEMDCFCHELMAAVEMKYRKVHA